MSQKPLWVAWRWAAPFESLWMDDLVRLLKGLLKGIYMASLMGSIGFRV